MLIKPSFLALDCEEAVIGTLTLLKDTATARIKKVPVIF